MPWWIAVLNTFAALTSTGFGATAVLKPSLMAPPVERYGSSRFYPATYAARAIPLGLAVGAAVWSTPEAASLLLLLGAAMLAQVGDIIIATTHRLPGMLAGAAFAVLCHGAAVLALL